MCKLKHELYLYSLFYAKNVIAEYPDAVVSLWSRLVRDQEDNIEIIKEDLFSPSQSNEMVFISNNRRINGTKVPLENMKDYCRKTNADYLFVTKFHNNNDNKWPGDKFRNVIHELESIEGFLEIAKHDINHVGGRTTLRGNTIKEHIGNMTVLSYDSKYKTITTFLVKVEYALGVLAELELPYNKIAMRLPPPPRYQPEEFSEELAATLRKGVKEFFKEKYGINNRSLDEIISVLYCWEKAKND